MAGRLGHREAVPGATPMGHTESSPRPMLRYLAIAAQSLVLSVVYAVFVLAVRAVLSSNMTGPKQS